MNNKFDELAKELAQSVSRRQALKRFSVGLAGLALACFGLGSKAEAQVNTCVPYGGNCSLKKDPKNKCCVGLFCFATGDFSGVCL